MPVVYFDADNDTQLELNDDNTPTDAEPFGIGGMLNVLPEEANDRDPVTPVDICDVNGDADDIVANDDREGPTRRDSAVGPVGDRQGRARTKPAGGRILDQPATASLGQRSSARCGMLHAQAEPVRITRAFWLAVVCAVSVSGSVSSVSRLRCSTEHSGPRSCRCGSHPVRLAPAPGPARSSRSTRRR